MSFKYAGAAPEVLSPTPSKDPDGVALDVRSVTRNDRAPCAVGDVHAGQSILYDGPTIKKGYEPKSILVGRIDKHIHVGIRTGLVAGVRTEQIKRRNTVRPQLRFNGFELGNDFQRDS